MFVRTLMASALALTVLSAPLPSVVSSAEASVVCPAQYGKRLNLRTGPGTHFKILTSLKSGTPLKVLDKKGSWVKVETGHGKFGWVFSRFVCAH